ncbi:YqhA family protein [uncultured Methanoregula sp.]|uniref:YqhA family protein n=1 Tax=uncultured Methanoregula sp. TaxID=1005933 RepID=UPI002AAAD4F5|nr:YqhA family protein [uncultured Methanoregula sp.]
MLIRFLSLRYISLIAVISLFVGAALMFIIGAVRTLNAVLILFLDAGVFNYPEHLDRGTLSSVALVQSVDAFLFALVLLIFSYGIYNLFINSPTENHKQDLPSWLRINSIGELKTTLLQVIIVILAVNVLEHVILVGSEALKWETLIIPISILCLAGALLMMHSIPSGHKEE